VKATVAADQGGPHAGETVEVLADDYASKGDEELIEVKVGDDLIFIEKKFIKLGSSALEPSTEAPESAPKSKSPKEEMLDEDEEEISVADLDDEDDDEEEDDDDNESSTGVPTDLETLRAKLKKSLTELEDIKSDMSTTFTSTDTISSTIQSLRGMIDALRKDQMNILSNR
jgi:hypothetical protein